MNDDRPIPTTHAAEKPQRQVSFRDVDRALTVWLRKHDPAYLRNSNTRRARGDCRELPDEPGAMPMAVVRKKGAE